MAGNQTSYKINFAVLNKVRWTTLIDDKVKGTRFTVFTEIYFTYGINKQKGAELAASVIADNTGISLSTVNRSIKDLQQIGAITNIMKGKRTKKGCEFETAVWKVNEDFILESFVCHNDTRIVCHNDTDINNIKKENLCQDDTGKEEKNFVTSNTLEVSSPSSSLCEDSGIGFKRINYITSNGLPF